MVFSFIKTESDNIGFLTDLESAALTSNPKSHQIEGTTNRPPKNDHQHVSMQNQTWYTTSIKTQFRS